MKDRIVELTAYTAPSGSERELAEHLLQLVADSADETYIDTLGNAIAHKKGKGPHALITAHMDEPGVMVIHIDDDGFLRLVVVGALTPVQLVGRQVKFTNGVNGVIQAEDSKDAPTVDKLYIDIGAGSKEEALQSVDIGLAGVVQEDIEELSDTVLTGRALDNRVGCAIAIEAFQQVAAQGKNVTIAFTSQETVGSRGAKTVAHRVQPDWALVIDGAPAGDAPGAKRMDLKLGKGPAVKVMDKSAIVPLAIKNHLVDSAKSAEVDVQFEVWPDGSGDVGSLHLATAGIPTGGLSYPVRYIDSTSPVIDVEDAKKCVVVAVKAILDKA